MAFNIHFLAFILLAVSLKTRLLVVPFTSFHYFLFVRFGCTFSAAVAYNHCRSRVNFLHFTKSKTFIRSRPSKTITIIVIILSGDIQVNPGPTSIYSCGCCELPVTWDHQRAVCCDNCKLWYHSECIELKECVDYIKPDAIIGCESWLSSDYTDSESFPCGYQTNVFRKDQKKNGGGVFISVHESLTAIEIDNNNSSCEVIWAEVQTQGNPITIGALYRPPSAKESSLKDLACSMQGIKHKQNKHIVLGGDFNLPRINWKKKSIKAGSNQHIQHQQLLDMEQELGFEQMQHSPSRESNILDLYFTTYPKLVESCYNVPGISDHHMVVVDCDVKPRYKKKIIYLQKGKLDQYQIKSKSPKYVHYPLS